MALAIAKLLEKDSGVSVQKIVDQLVTFLATNNKTLKPMKPGGNIRS